MQQEGSFHPDSVGCDATHSKGFACSAPSDANEGALEGLHALAFTLDDADVYLDCVARVQLRDTRVSF
jgi:hypothetical protein